MGKRLSISQPTVIDTELTPLTDNIEIIANGSLEQWYYVNTNTIAPNREETPLRLTPSVVCVDRETNTKYTNPVLDSVVWKVRRFVINGIWGETTIVTRSETEPFYLLGNSLIVTQNNKDPMHAISVVCSISYVDPRDSGIIYSAEVSVNLTCNRDATVSYPTILINAPSTTNYNPLSDNSSQFTFTASADWSNVPLVEGMNSNEGRGQFVWYGVNSSGTEVLIDTLPCYVSGQNTSTLKIDAKYGNNIPIILRIKENLPNAPILPPKAFANVTWQIPPLKGIVQCDNGSFVRTGNDTPYTFKPIVNTNRGLIEENKAKENLLFAWFMRNATPRVDGSSVTQDDSKSIKFLGWGYETCVSAKDLIYTYGSKNASKLVYNEIYLLDAFEQVTYNGDLVYYGTTDNIVMGRGIDVDINTNTNTNTNN